MKTGLLITTFNRPDYLSQCLESVSNIGFSGELEILIVDDASTDKETIELINSFCEKWPSVRKMFLPKNKGIANALRIGFNYLFASGCHIVINLDADAIVKPEFVDVLTNLKFWYPFHIISGFNTQTIDLKTAKVRHRTIAVYDGHCTKESIGGINMLIDEKQYKTIVLPALKLPGHWDWNVCKMVKEFIVSTPSVVQHIGIEKGINMNNPDVAFDF
jgi:glycosyltransferase involved in cell wall biosynthesis